MRYAAGTIAALMLLWLLVAVLLLATGGCSPRVAALEPSGSVTLRRCFRVAVAAQPLPVILGACAETMATCNAVRELALRQGSLAGLMAVGACK